MIALGHSTTEIGVFLAALKELGVRVLADVRTVPRSRHNPQFEQQALAAALEQSGIGYAWLKGLGGFRKPLPDSQNAGWRNPSFRGYADYMQTPRFPSALRELLELGPPESTAFMCSELLPWRCHRSLIADALLARGVPVDELMITPKGNVLRPHNMTPFAQIVDGCVTYPPEQQPLSLNAE